MEGRIQRDYRYLVDELELESGWNDVLTIQLNSGFYVMDFKATLENIEWDIYSSRSLEAGVFIGSVSHPNYVVGEASWSPESSTLTYTHLSILGVPMWVYDTNVVKFKIRTIHNPPEYWIVKAEEYTRCDILRFNSGRLVEF